MDREAGRRGESGSPGFRGFFFFTKRRPFLAGEAGTGDSPDDPPFCPYPVTCGEVGAMTIVVLFRTGEPGSAEAALGLRFFTIVDPLARTPSDSPSSPEN